MFHDIPQKSSEKMRVGYFCQIYGVGCGVLLIEFPFPKIRSIPDCCSPLRSRLSNCGISIPKSTGVGTTLDTLGKVNTRLMYSIFRCNAFFKK